MSKLIPCKTCARQLSFNADTCPNCGHNMKKDRQDKANLYQTVALAGLLLLVVFLFKTGVAQSLIHQIPLVKELKH